MEQMTLHDKTLLSHVNCNYVVIPRNEFIILSRFPKKHKARNTQGQNTFTCIRQMNALAVQMNDSCDNCIAQ